MVGGEPLSRDGDRDYTHDAVRENTLCQAPPSVKIKKKTPPVGADGAEPR